MCFLLLSYLLQPLYQYSFKACKLTWWKILNVKGRLSSYINVEFFTKLWGFLMAKISLKKKSFWGTSLIHLIFSYYYLHLGSTAMLSMKLLLNFFYCIVVLYISLLFWFLYFEFSTLIWWHTLYIFHHCVVTFMWIITKPTSFVPFMKCGGQIKSLSTMNPFILKTKRNELKIQIFKLVHENYTSFKINFI